MRNANWLVPVRLSYIVRYYSAQTVLTAEPHQDGEWDERADAHTASTQQPTMHDATCIYSRQRVGVHADVTPVAPCHG